MSKDSNCDNFQLRVQRLRSLREKLCTQSSEWAEAFEFRDYVIDELQEMHTKLASDPAGVDPEWCKNKVEQILSRMSALPDQDAVTGEDNA